MARSFQKFGLTGVAFVEVGGAFRGFSAAAESVTISGGFELTPGMNASGFHLQSFRQVAEATLTIDGISDATPALMAALRGGKLQPGSDSLNTSLRIGKVLGFGGTNSLPDNFDLADALITEPGLYRVSYKRIVPADAGPPAVVSRHEFVVHRIYQGAEFAAFADKPAEFWTSVNMGYQVPTAAAGDDWPDDRPAPVVGTAAAHALVWVEEATSRYAGRYVFGSAEGPPEFSVYGLSQLDRAASPANRNVERLQVPRWIPDPFDAALAAGEINRFSVGGKIFHDSGIGASWRKSAGFGAIA